MSVCKRNAKSIREIETKIAKYIFNSYIKGKCDISQTDFMSKLFFKSKGVISQTALLKEELDLIDKATKDYILHPDKYINNKKTVYGYPDEFRCNHIIYKKHKFTRCKNKIDEENGGDTFCLHHWDSENPYETDYQNLVDKLEE